MTPPARVPGSTARCGLVLAAVLVLLDGCTSCIDPGGGGCSRYCSQKCETDDECTGSDKCVGGCCSECEYDSDCPAPTGCLVYVCNSPSWNNRANWCEATNLDNGDPCTLGAYGEGECQYGECVAITYDDAISDGDAWTYEWTGDVCSTSCYSEVVCDDASCSQCWSDEDCEDYVADCEGGGCRCIANACEPIPCSPPCGEHERCQAGACVPKACVPRCDDKVCGEDGCGGLCGACERYHVCLDGACVPCASDCEGRVCGSDGCFGSCGECASGVCTADGTACVRPEPVLAGARVDAAYFPATSDEIPWEHPTLVGARCLDLTGDGIPDDGFGALASTLAGFGVDLNDTFQGAIDDVERALLLQFEDGGNDSRLSGYVGRLTETPAEYEAAPGEPALESFAARLDEATLCASADTANVGGILSFLFDDTFLALADLPLARVRIEGLLDGAPDDSGFVLRDGVVGGMFFKADLDLGLYESRLWCATDPEAPSDVCGYLSMSDMSLVETFLAWDLDVPSCTKELNVYDPADPLVVVGHEPNCQAVSVCAYWSAEKARFKGPFPAAVNSP